MTVSISAKSTPRAATSVHSNTAGVRCEAGKLIYDARAISRTRGGRSPCSEVNAKLANSGRRDRIWFISFVIVTEMFESRHAR